METERERARARIVWESLERAVDHLTPGHPAELHIRRALAAAELQWQRLLAEAETRRPGQESPAQRRG